MSNPLPEDVRLALGAGRKPEAIRLLREHTGLGLAEAIRLLREARGVGLKEAKDRVDAFQRGRGGQDPRSAPRLAAGDSGSRIRLLIVIAAVVAAVDWLLFRKG